MNTVLVFYWIKRFALIFVIVGAALLALQVLREGIAAIDLAGVALWSAAPAALSASINTWWVRNRGCRLR